MIFAFFFLATFGMYTYLHTCDSPVLSRSPVCGLLQKELRLHVEANRVMKSDHDSTSSPLVQKAAIKPGAKADLAPKQQLLPSTSLEH
jgi:hypothetical protein